MPREPDVLSLENSFDCSRRALSLIDRNRRFVRVNRKFAEMLGLPAQEIVGKICHELVHHTPFCIEGCPFSRMMESRSGETLDFEDPGTGRWFRVAVDPIPDGNGGIAGALHAVMDITEMKRAQREADRLSRERKEAAEMLSSLLNNVPGAVYRGMRDWSLRFFGAGIRRMTGYAPEEFLRGEIDWRRVVHPDDLPGLKERFRGAVAAKEKTVRVEYRIVRRDGTMRRVEDNRQNIYDADGRFSHVDGLLMDVSERKAMEDELLRARADWEETFDNLMDAVTVHDKDFHIVRANRAARELLKLPPLGEGPPADCFRYYHGTEKPPEECPSCQSISAGLPSTCEIFEPHLNIHMELRTIPRFGPDGRVAGSIHVVRDITDRKRREEELRKSNEMLRHSQKMEAVGRLAGGVAHDFNNILTVIGGYSDLLAQRLPPDSPLRRDVEEIRKAEIRASSLTRQLLAFSRKQVISPGIADLNEVVSGMERMMRRLIGENIDLVTVLRPGLWNVRVDTGQIEQVLLNLVVNARDAMPGAGKILIETENGEIDAEMAALHGFGRPGEYAVLSVRDNGCGMDEETLRHVFEPFYTTKERGKGTGLGLATAYGIVKQSDGYITVESRPGEGSIFRVFLPRCNARPDSPAAKAKDGGVAVGKETVLLVEDDEMVRGCMRAALSSGGYTLFEAADGEEAVAVLRETARPIDLVVTDVIMPRMGGKELGDWIAANRPEVKILFVSGYVGNDSLRERRFGRGESYLQKPFLQDELLRAVRKALDQEPGEQPRPRSGFPRGK
jgi:PAS domain S-box-containing protein